MKRCERSSLPLKQRAWHARWLLKFKRTAAPGESLVTHQSSDMGAYHKPNPCTGEAGPRAYGAVELVSTTEAATEAALPPGTTQHTRGPSFQPNPLIEDLRHSLDDWIALTFTGEAHDLRRCARGTVVPSGAGCAGGRTETKDFDLTLQGLPRPMR